MNIQLLQATSGCRALLAGGLVLMAAFACDNKAPKQPPPLTPDGTPQVSADEMKQSVQQLGQDLTKLGNEVGAKVAEETKAALQSFQERQESYTQSARDQLGTLRAEVDRLKQDAQRLGDAARQRMQSSLADLDDQTARADQHFSRLKETTADRWESTKAEMSRLIGQLDDACQRAAQRLQGQ